MRVELDRVAVGLGDGGRGAQRGVVGDTVDGHVRGERVRLAVALEVREDAVRAGVGQRDRRAPGAIGAERRMQVLEAAPVAPDDDQVHALLVGDLEVAHRAVRPVDGETQRGRLAARKGRRGEREPQAVLGDREAADRVGGGHLAMLVVHTPVGLRRRSTVTIRADRAARNRGDAEHQAEQEREARELGDGVHAGTAS